LNCLIPKSEAVFLGEGKRMEMVHKYGKALLWFGVVLLALLFTPVGGIVNLFVSGGALIGAVILFFSALFELLSFRDWNYGPYWRGIGLKLAGTVGLLLLAFICMSILPKPPISGSNDFCIETRSNPC
jgi:ABC-type uncharacterized transport system permease subunit